MKAATWRNGRRSLSGHWSYSWARDQFVIVLGRDRISGQPRSFIVTGDTPEWGNWRLVR
jgi:hypothetical protein